MPPFLRYAKAKHVCLLGSIAVTFGTFGKFFDRRGLSGKPEIRSSLFFIWFAILTTKTQTSHYLVIAFNVCALQIIQQTSTLGDHFQQAPSRVIVFLMYLEVFGKLVDSLAQ